MHAYTLGARAPGAEPWPWHPRNRACLLPPSEPRLPGPKPWPRHQIPVHATSTLGAQAPGAEAMVITNPMHAPMSASTLGAQAPRAEATPVFIMTLFQVPPMPNLPLPHTWSRGPRPPWSGPRPPWNGARTPWRDLLQLLCLPKNGDGWAYHRWTAYTSTSRGCHDREQKGPRRRARFLVEGTHSYMRGCRGSVWENPLKGIPLDLGLQGLGLMPEPTCRERSFLCPNTSERNPRSTPALQSSIIPSLGQRDSRRIPNSRESFIRDPGKEDLFGSQKENIVVPRG